MPETILALFLLGFTLLSIFRFGRVNTATGWLLSPVAIAKTIAIIIWIIVTRIN